MRIGPRRTPRTLRDKVVVITGAGGGMGREMALLAARRGALLAVPDWDADALARLVEQADIAAALRRVVAVSISAAADAPLAGLGFRGRRTAAAPNQADLLAELDSLLAERRAVAS